MTLTQNWVGYLDRSFEQIKQSCLTQLGITAPEISDYNESNPLIIILSMFSGIGEMLNLYIDAIAQEAFLGTARRFSSAVKLVKLIDYNIPATNSATVNILISLVDTSGNPTTYTAPIVIPAGTIINSPSAGIGFVLANDLTIPMGDSNAIGSATNYTVVTNNILGNTNGTANQILQISSAYVDGSMSIIINGITYTLYKSFGLMSNLTPGFIVSIDVNQNAYIEFGDGVNGVIPPSGAIIYGTYRESAGSSGNLPPNTITQFATPPTPPTGITINVTNPDYSSGGTDFATLADIQNRAPLSIRTLDRAVTYQDYKDLASSVLGVGAVEIGYCCGKFVNLFIAPNAAGTATLGLLQSVMDFMQQRVMITTQLSVQASGISLIWLNATVYGKPGALAADIWADVTNALNAKYGYSSLIINRTVSVTEIIILVNAIPSVDHIDIDEVKIQPFPRPYGTTSNPLNIDFLVLPTTAVNIMYRVTWRAGSGTFDIFRNTFLLGSYAPGYVYTETAFSFKLLAGTYTDGDSWTFTAYQSYPEIFPDTVIPMTDYSAAIVDVTINTGSPNTIFSNLTIVPTQIKATPLPQGNCM